MQMSNRNKKPNIAAPKYTLYIVSRSRDHHYPVLMANNGKVALNEPSGRAAKLEISAQRFLDACSDGYTTIERITEADFKAKYPSFAPNKGGKKAKAEPPIQPFKKGDKAVVNDDHWGKCKATVLRVGLHNKRYWLRITEGEYKGYKGVWEASEITKPKPRTQPFKKGDKVVVNAGVWGKCKAAVLRRGLHEGDWRVRITEGPHKGHEGTWDQLDITKA